MLGPWNRTGLGSAISGGALADLLLSGAVHTWAHRWTGGVLYLVPLVGATSVIGAGMAGRAGAVVMEVVAGLGVGVDVVLSGSLRWHPVMAPGSGAWALHTAVLLLVFSVVLIRIASWRIWD